MSPAYNGLAEGPPLFGGPSRARCWATPASRLFPLQLDLEFIIGSLDGSAMYDNMGVRNVHGDKISSTTLRAHFIRHFERDAQLLSRPPVWIDENGVRRSDLPIRDVPDVLLRDPPRTKAADPDLCLLWKWVLLRIVEHCDPNRHCSRLNPLGLQTVSGETEK